MMHYFVSNRLIAASIGRLYYLQEKEGERDSAVSKYHHPILYKQRGLHEIHTYIHTYQVDILQYTVFFTFVERDKMYLPFDRYMILYEHENERQKKKQVCW